MAGCRVFLCTAAVMSVSLLRRTQATILLEYLSTPVTPETTSADDYYYYVNATTDGASSSSLPGIVEISYQDVERSLQQKEDVIIDVRNFDEVTEFGQIPSAHVLPGSTLKTLYAVN